jgi:hypothetical protein
MVNKASDEGELQLLEDLLKIDEAHLLQEWKGQSILLMQSMRLWGRAQAALTTVEKDLKETYGKLFLGAKRYGIPDIPKPSDEVAKRHAETQQEYSDLMDLYIEAEHRLILCKGLAKAFEQRAMALKYVQANTGVDSNKIEMGYE